MKQSDAELSVRQALRAQPTDAAAHEQLGLHLLRQGRRTHAAAAFGIAIKLKPSARAYMNLALSLSRGPRKAYAATVLRDAAAAFPDDERVAAALGRTLLEQDRLDEAADVLDAALRRWPHSTRLIRHYGLVLYSQGRIEDAVSWYWSSLAANPDSAATHSALLFALHFLPGITPEQLLDEHRAWDRRHAPAHRAQAAPFANDRNPDRRLRIGYVSADFRNHSVGRFIAPVLASHDRRHVETFAYSDAVLSDATTRRIRGSIDQWRDINGRTHERVAEQIRQDRIDILVDLTMHMPGNRMLVFARRAAPVQVTYLAYCATTGLAAMDYRLSDAYLDPSGWDSRYAERTVRLPGCWWLYEAPHLAPEVVARADSPIVFGCLNNFVKVSDAARRAWVAILQSVPESRLLLLCPEGRARARAVAAVTAGGIAADRLEFTGRVPFNAYLAAHQRIDVALDPFPYGGGTTSCDALWMGVPVVTLSAETAFGRGTGSLLTRLGLSGLIAPTREAYVDCAVSLARDRERRASLRGELRERMRSSAIMDVRGFMTGIEAAYRAMWRDWCERPDGPGPRSETGYGG